MTHITSNYSNDNYRLYTWQLFQLNSMQQGIQALHVLGELNAKYPLLSGSVVEAHKLHTYQTIDKTVICLNGGNYMGMVHVWNSIRAFAEILGLPAAHFCEDQESLNGIMTACGIVVPESVWGAVVDSEIDNKNVSPELELAVFLRQFSLAR